MNKAIPVVAIVFLGGIAALLVWKFSGDDPVPQPRNGGDEIVNVRFEPEDFIPTFDTDGDGRVTLEEFKQRYGKPLEEGKPAFILYNPQTNKPISAEDAFNKHWDRDSSGVVDRRDIALIADKAWYQFFVKATQAGLTPVRLDGNFYALNEHQNRTMEAEVGAQANKQVPYAGQFWDRKYFKNWVRVTDPVEGVVEGFGLEQDGRLYILTPDASLTVKNPEKVTIETIADAPQMKYAEAVIGLSFSDAKANLALADKCIEWGMRPEAGVLYARVLITEPDNQKALDALGYVRDGDQFKEKGD